MEKQLKAKSIEAGNSGYIIEVVESETKKYIKLSQIIYKGKQKGQNEINLNPTVLHNFISTLAEYQNIYFDDLKSNRWQTSYIDQQEIINRYLKGVPLKEIAKHFDTKVSYLESILRNNDIELVSKEEPTYKDTSKYWKYKNRY